MPARETTIDLAAAVVTPVSDGAVANAYLQHAFASSGASHILIRATLTNAAPAQVTTALAGTMTAEVRGTNPQGVGAWHADYNPLVVV